jgi:hypothetical protein
MSAHRPKWRGLATITGTVRSADLGSSPSICLAPTMMRQAKRVNHNWADTGGHS